MSQPLDAPAERDFETGRGRKRLAETQKLQRRGARVAEYEDPVADLIDQSRRVLTYRIVVDGEGVTEFHRSVSSTELRMLPRACGHFSQKTRAAKDLESHLGPLRMS